MLFLKNCIILFILGSIVKRGKKFWIVFLKNCEVYWYFFLSIIDIVDVIKIKVENY